MSAPLRVAVNLTWLVPGVVGGTETYATGLLRALARCPRERHGVELMLVALPALAQAHPDLTAAFPTTFAPLPPGRHVVRRVALESTWLPAVLQRARPDVVHHLGGVVPPGSRAAPGASVVTVHDLQYLHHPEYFSRAKRAYLHAVTVPSLRAADVVMTPSRFTGQDLVSRLGVQADRVVVVPPVLQDLAPPDGPGPDAHDAMGAMGDGRRWVHYPAALYPHKNHLTLLAAFAQLAADLPDVDLVLTGASGAGAWGSAGSVEVALRDAISRAGLQQRVRVLGHLERARYQRVAHGAAAMAFPSRFEGYGLPVAEAMRAGVPVLAADAGALPEVVGSAPAGAMLLHPDDTAGWERALREVLTDAGVRTRLAADGRRRAAQLGGEAPLTALLQGYRRAAARCENAVITP